MVLRTPQFLWSYYFGHPDARYHHLGKLSKTPARFEPLLKQQPHSLAHRIAAIDWYSRREPNFQALRRHTFQLIHRYPESQEMFSSNVVEFYRYPEYLNEVLARFQAKAQRGYKGHRFYYLYAEILKLASIPRFGGSEENKKRSLRYFGLTEDAEVLSKIDSTLAEEAARYFKRAIRAAQGDIFSPSFYARQYLGLLINLGRTNEALEVCQRALSRPDDSSRGGLLVDYGKLLWGKGQVDEAIVALEQVRLHDKETWKPGSDDEEIDKVPGCETMQAEMYLGQIALERGNLDDAEHHLLASCAVSPCPHTKTKAFPLTLPKKLFNAGRLSTVIQFCETVLNDFCPGQIETMALLDRAKQRVAA